MKKVWLIQEYNSMAIDFVATTKTKALKQARQFYPKSPILEKINNTNYALKESKGYCDPTCYIFKRELNCTYIRKNKLI